MDLNFIAFLFLSALAIFCGLMTVLSKNPIHSVLYIVACFFAIAGHYALLGAHFLSAVQIIVYAGAIMVLFLSTLMLMNLNEETEKHKPAIVRMGAVVAGGLLLLVMAAALHKATSMPVATPDTNVSSIANLGKVLLDEYLFPFEFTSILFLSAMIGVVLLTKKDKVQNV